MLQLLVYVMPDMLNYSSDIQVYIHHYLAIADLDEIEFAVLK